MSSEVSYGNVAMDRSARLVSLRQKLTSRECKLDSALSESSAAGVRRLQLVSDSRRSYEAVRIGDRAAEVTYRDPATASSRKLGR